MPPDAKHTTPEQEAALDAVSGALIVYQAPGSQDPYSEVRKTFLEARTLADGLSAVDPTSQELAKTRLKLIEMGGELAHNRLELAEIKAILKELREDKLSVKVRKLFTQVKNTTMATAKAIWEGRHQDGGIKGFFRLVTTQISRMFRKISETAKSVSQTVGDFAAVVSDEVRYIGQKAEAHINYAFSQGTGTALAAALRWVAYGGQKVEANVVKDGEATRVEDYPSKQFAASEKKAREGHLYKPSADNTKYSPKHDSELGRRQDMRTKLANIPDDLARQSKALGSKILSTGASLIPDAVVKRLPQKAQNAIKGARTK